MRARLRIDPGSVAIPLRVGGTGEAVRAEVSPPFMPVYPTPYEGEYTVVPGEDAQALPTAGKSLAQDVTVEPIPSNYGRIAWNGAAIMVY